MRYMGSKRALAKDLAPIIQHCIDKYGFGTYLEPFVGGANMMEHIQASLRLGNDINPYLRALFKHLQAGGELPNDISREEYNAVHGAYRGLTGEYPDWLIGCVGFLSSFRGKFFGGYSGEQKRNYYQEFTRNLLKQFPGISDVVFDVAPYQRITLSRNTLIYCDPPYASTTGYGMQCGFDHTEFWNTVREWSKKTFVLISEEFAPDDFKVLWEKPITRALGTNRGFVATERLYYWGDVAG